MLFPGLSDSYTVPQQTTELSDFDTFVKNGLAVVSNGNTHLAIPADMYVYVYGHNTLSTGLYQNISGAEIAASATLSTSNVALVPGGGLNALKASLTNLDSDDIANASTNVSGATVTAAVDNLKSAITNLESSGIIIGEQVTIHGTTDSYGLITTSKSKRFGSAIYALTNISETLATDYSVTVNGITSNTVTFRIRKMGDNTSVSNTYVNFGVMIVGFRPQ